jgi:hypothetical protein
MIFKKVIFVSKYEYQKIGDVADNGGTSLEIKILAFYSHFLFSTNIRNSKAV